MSEELTPYEWVAGSSPAAREWRQSLIQRWEQGGAKVFQRVFRQAQTQEPGALFRQPATKIERPPTGKYFSLPAQPAGATGAYFNVPGMEGNRVGHRAPPATPKPARLPGGVTEMAPAPLTISGQFREILNPDEPVVFE